jgi:hypothetical protein
MALRFCDSADHYVTADMLEKWNGSTGTWTISAGNGRHGSASIRQGSESAQNLSKTLDSQGTWIFGFAYKRPDFTITSQGIVAQMLDAGTVQVSLLLNVDGRLSVWRGTATAQLATTTLPVIKAGVWHYIEWKVTIHNTTGAVEVRVDGVSVCSASSQNTRASTNNSANQLRLGGGSVVTGAATNLDYDDVYMCDSSGSLNNDFLGDIRVDAMLPNGEGSNSQWTCSTGSTHYQLVDESAPNDDTDYLSTAGASNRDSHAMANLPTMTSPVIKGVMQSISAKKDDAGSRNIKSLCKSGATTSTGTSQALPSSYAYLTQIWETDPNTAAAWTEANLNAAEFGVENV